jgi:hypothetical protein
MINVKEAVQKAAEYFADVYPNKYPNVLVEEIERTNGDWLITLGYDIPDISALLSRKPTRHFKLFKIDGQTGEVLSMKIREVEHVE